MRFVVTIAPPLSYPHREAFREVAETVHLALLRLGHVSTLSDDLGIRNRRHIVFGSNTLSWWDLEVPDDAILYNLEQIVPGSKWAREDLLSLLRRHTVWDYSLHNVKALEAQGARNVRHVPIGAVPELNRIPVAGRQDIDILLVGGLNDRRRWPIEQLRDTGLNVHALTDIYGPARDKLYARAKIVLNIHYDLRVFEIVRVSYLLANGIFVVSEDCVNQDETAEFSDAVVFADYDRIVETCLRYLADPEARAARAAAGSEIMRRRPAVKYLRDAVNELRTASV